MKHRSVIVIAGVAAFLMASTSGLCGAPAYPWHPGRVGDEALATRIPPPPGYERLPGAAGSFASWLRGLPLREPGAQVRLHDGRVRSDQGGVFAVIDVDVGPNDLQQCADAVIRLRAEYLRSRGCDTRIAFRFTSGHLARWSEWRAGYRPVVSGREVSWVLRGDPDSAYASFRQYLGTVFMYAGSFSLARELTPVPNPSAVRPGDVFIHGGFPGHALIVADVAQDSQGRRVFLLAQSYMPAQDVHVLMNPSSPGSPWYPALDEGSLVTPDWVFAYTDLRRFSEPDCGAPDPVGLPLRHTLAPERPASTSPRAPSAR